jgi:hypothetical protein
VAVREFFVSGDGNDAQDGTTWATRVRTFTRARALAAGVAAPDRVSFVIGQFNMSRKASFGQQLGKGIDANNVPDGWSMRARDPNLPWHFIDLDVLNQASDFVQVFKNGTSFNAATAGCPHIVNNGGTPAGQATGIWVTTRDVADADKPLYRVARVWRGGNPLTIGDPAAVPSAYDPYNEIWEARDFTTLGLDETHTWTQLTPGEVWPEEGQSELDPAPTGGRLFVFSPQGNPASKWGGVTVLTQWSAAASVVFELGFLTIQQSNGWHVDESIKAIGGGVGAFKIRGGCTEGRFEARVDVFSPYYPVLDLQPHSTLNSFTAIEVSPRWDQRVVGKPYYEIDSKHGTGQSDGLRIGAAAQVSGLLVRGRTSANDELNYVRDPGHSAIGRPVPTTGVVDGLVVERDFSVYLGGAQYQRAFGINGTATNMLNATISGRVYGQRTPSQIEGNVKVIGAEFHYGQQVIPAAPDNTTVYTNRFNSRQRVWANVHPDGKNRDCSGLVVFFNGTVEVRDCVFDAIHGSALHILTQSGPQGVSCLVENCTFVNSAVPGSQKTAVLVDTRNNAPAHIRLNNNKAVGYPTNGGAQWTSNGFDRPSIRPEDLHLVPPNGAGISQNTGWVRQLFAACYG